MSRLYYKQGIENTAKTIDHSLFSEPNETHKYNIQVKCEVVLVLKQLVQAATTFYKV